MPGGRIGFRIHKGVVIEKEVLDTDIVLGIVSIIRNKLTSPLYFSK